MSKIKTKKVMDYKRKYEMLADHMDELVSDLAQLVDDIEELNMGSKSITSELKRFVTDSTKFLVKTERTK
jgi:predicted nuclease with TOPRIM domain